MNYSQHKGKQLANKMKEELKQEQGPQKWYADELVMSKSEWQAWLRGLTSTRQDRFEQANKLKENYDQAN